MLKMVAAGVTALFVTASPIAPHKSPTSAAAPERINPSGPECTDGHAD